MLSRITEFISDPDRVDRLFWSHVECAAPNACWLWRGTMNSSGYGYVNWPTGRHLYAHRVVATLFYGAIPDKMQACHRCDNARCVNPAHLFIGSNSDNTMDSVRKRRDLKRKKLTEDQVRDMRQLRAAGSRLRELAVRYGVTETQVSNIVRRLQWQIVM